MAHDFIIKEGRLSSSKLRATVGRMMHEKHEAFKKDNPGVQTRVMMMGEGDFPGMVAEPRQANECFFNGYQGGFMYRIFDAQKHDRGISGDAEPIIISKSDAIDGLLAAAAYLEREPDPYWHKFAEDFRLYVHDVVAASSKNEFTIIFC